MIVRGDRSTFLLIAQSDHAQLAEELVGAIRTEPSLFTPARDTILLATREHDNGWVEVDAEPTIDPASGRPRDFMTGPAAVKLELWLRGITRASRMDPKVGALVAEHATTVYAYRQRDPEWRRFFESIPAMRDDLLQQLGIASGAGREAFQADYRCVRLGDAFSLQFCNGWVQPEETLGYRATVDGTTLCISPDPFGGRRVPLRVLARRIAARRYADDADLRTALGAAVPEILAGEAHGR